jgi:hypothetical protein
MFRGIAKIIALAVMVVAGAAGIFVYQARYSQDHRISELLGQKKELERVVQRLNAEQRRAQMLVTDQRTVDGKLRTTLLFVEYARDGSSLPPQSFVIEGKWVHIDALVIKFEPDYVGRGDALRGHSLCLFTRLYGDNQTPARGFPIDEPGKIPDIYRGVSPRVSEFEETLWADFWKLADDAAYRKEQHVRVANGQGVWGPFEPGKLYTITLEANGGMNLQNQPVEGIYKEAMMGTKME